VVLAVSAADRDSEPARQADRVVCVGPARSADSYLNAAAIVHAAVATGADAIHPGYGFLSERAILPQLCAKAGVIFIGPTADQIAAIGDKLRARAEAEAANVPVVPGGAANSCEEAQILARKIALPLLVKAVGGGGGRGLKRVARIEDLPEMLELAAAEAGAAFGDARLYLEHYIDGGRHVEVQLLGDGEGGVIQLGERDCSVQRRYQKLIEETPAPGLSAALRDSLQQAAVRFAERLDYRGAGTVEFIVDTRREAFYFLEMNARIQVEHPVTEVVTGIDLIAEQIAIADGSGLRLRQSEIRTLGCAIECRVNAEDYRNEFRPSPGRVRDVSWAGGEGIRVDSHVVPGSSIPPFYDSLMGKIIASGPNRATALARQRNAIAVTRINGVKSNLGFHIAALDDTEFQFGGVDTGFVDRLYARRRDLCDQDEAGASYG
jgi:acetyl-CoA carboxylase biotin carboxylase subunit